MKSEYAVSQEVLLNLSKRGCRVFRNNSGAVTTEDGRHIRFGLGNTSAILNKKIKSSDLIGITPTIITPEHVGQTVGIFTAIEVKHGGWRFNPGDDHARAQLKFLEIIHSLGGIGTFISDADQLDAALRRVRTYNM